MRKGSILLNGDRIGDTPCQMFIIIQSPFETLYQKPCETFYVQTQFFFSYYVLEFSKKIEESKRECTLSKKEFLWQKENDGLHRYLRLCLMSSVLQGCSIIL